MASNAVNPLTVDRWIVQRLENDATLTGLLGGAKVFSDVAPLGTSSPWLIFSQQSSRDVFGVGSERYMGRQMYLVRATGLLQSFATLEPIVQRVDALLHGSGGTVSSGTVMSLLRQESVRYTEVADGQEYRHLGAIYEALTI